MIKKEYYTYNNYLGELKVNHFLVPNNFQKKIFDLINTENLEDNKFININTEARSGKSFLPFIFAQNHPKENITLFVRSIHKQFTLENKEKYGMNNISVFTPEDLIEKSKKICLSRYIIIDNCNLTEQQESSLFSLINKKLIERNPSKHLVLNLYTKSL